MTRKKVFFALAVALMVAVMVVGFILENSVSPVVTRLFGTLVDKPPEETVATTNDAARQLASEVEAQGAVLLANDGTLPLSNDVTKVNVFGWASVDWLGGGSGSGCVTSVETDLISALNDAGIETNTELTAMYQDFHAAGKRPKTLSSKPEESSVLYEPSIADRARATPTSCCKGSAGFLGHCHRGVTLRGRGNNDMPLVQYKVSEKNGSVKRTPAGPRLTSRLRRALLAYVGCHVQERHCGGELGKRHGAGPLTPTPGIDAVLLARATRASTAPRCCRRFWWGE